nr:hypothetical protein GCM10020063_069440 [Dactylosporangium thailandense]
MPRRPAVAPATRARLGPPPIVTRWRMPAAPTLTELSRGPAPTRNPGTLALALIRAGEAPPERSGWYEGRVEVSDRFWDVLESHGRSQARLVGWLREASEDEIVDYQGSFEAAAEELADYWDGPVVDGVQYSEDDTEDLCLWIVGEGRESWDAARVDFEGAIRRYLARDPDDLWVPGAPAYGIFYERSHRSLDERLG